MRQVTSLRVCVVLSVLRNGNKLLTPLWRVNITFSASTYCFHSFVLFVVQQSFLLTLMIFLSLPIIPRTLAVHRLTRCFEPIGTIRTEAIPCSSSLGQHQWHDWRLGEPRRRLHSKKTHKMKKTWGTSDVGQFFVTGPTDFATEPSHFYCRVFRRDVSVLTHGRHETLRHFQGSKHFPRDQRQAWKCWTMKGTPWVQQK